MIHSPINKKAPAGGRGESGCRTLGSYQSRPAPTTPPLFPRRQAMAARVLEALVEWEVGLDADELALRIGVERADVLLAADDLWMSGRITMRMLGSTCYLRRAL